MTATDSGTAAGARPDGPAGLGPHRAGDARAAPGRRGRTAGRGLPYLLILPAAATLLGVVGYPLVRLVELSLQNANDYLHLANPALIKYIGLETFRKVLADPAFWTSIERSLLFTAEVVVASIVCALAVAALLGRVSGWVRATVLTVLMFVWAIPAIVTGTLFRWLFANNGGAVDYLCHLLGGKGMLHHDWFVDQDQGLFVVVAVVVVWGALPFLVLGFHAAIGQVPRELTEAARIDGASPWQSFRHVVLPVIRPFLGIATALSFIWDFQVFPQIMALRAGSPEAGYQVIGVYLYEKGVGSSHYSSSAVISIAMILLMLTALVLYIRQALRTGDSD
jgi:N,N'-diacetylchitobiose transport system permease protein